MSAPQHNKQKTLSVVVPAHNESENVEPLIERLHKAIAPTKLDYEVIIVDDGSTDNTYEAAVAAAKENRSVRILRLSRSFGHQAALLAGLEASTGDAVITMDGDLQHPPELIPTLVESWQKGSEVVHTLRKDEQARTGLLKRFTSNLFYRLFRTQTGLAMRPGMADFRLVDRRALAAVLASNETRLFLRGLFVWVGFRQDFIPYQAAPRLHGSTSYSLTKMVRFAAHALLSFSERPLYWGAAAGVVLSMLAAAYGAYAVIINLLTDRTVPGWTSVVTFMAILMGTQFLLLGLLGAYVGAIYAEVKGRPRFVIAEDSAKERATQPPKSEASTKKKTGRSKTQADVQPSSEAAQ